MAGKKAGQSATSNVGELIDQVIAEFLPVVEGGSYYGRKLDDVPSGKTVLGQDRTAQVQTVSKALDRLVELEEKIGKFRATLKDSEVYNPHCKPGWFNLWNPRWVLMEIIRSLLRRSLPFDDPALIRLLRWPVAESSHVNTWLYPLSGIASAVEHFAKSNDLSSELKETITRLVRRLRENDHDKDCRKIADRLQAIVGGGPQVQLRPGEAWSDAAVADLAKMSSKNNGSWSKLLIHCQDATGGKPAKKWSAAAEELLAAIPLEYFKDHAFRWFALVDKPRTQPIAEWSEWAPNPNQLLDQQNAEILKGLVWCCSIRCDADVCRALTPLAISAYKKVPGIGPRAVALGNACVYALGCGSGMDGVAQLAILKIRVKFGTAQKGIEKALVATAEREGIPRDDLEEMSVPAYGLTDVGVRREELGDFTAELAVTGPKTELRWLKSDGKQQKSVPAAVKNDYGEDLKELKQAGKDIDKMIPAQAARIEQTYLAQKEWNLPTWRERYLDHPLVGTLARRLVWRFRQGKNEASAIYHDDRFVDARNRTVKWLDDTTMVSLWHPLDVSTDEILAWRDWLEDHAVKQPFKQAHREVYVLTDAERRTGVYSNRFAAHVLKQHQFNALCAARGWKNRLRLMVDDSAPPAYVELPKWQLRAEYWIEGAGEEYGVDTNETGTFLYLTTDQVRFYRDVAAINWAHASGGGYESGGTDRDENHPLGLDEIPSLVFSEVMRDVDLFVGVASVANDPNWSDGGPEGRYRDYWNSYSFGELGATAQTRKAVLERLIPRLKIADRCSFADRFLKVRGDLRSYKIHLGSGNILMEPNDEYLCIVAKQATAVGTDRVFLPFEGDNTMSIILSKAMLLAEDTKIKDSTITSQIKSKR